MADPQPQAIPSLPFSEACERNKEPILAVLRQWLGPAAPGQAIRVLEVGSGSGQHAVHMARHLPVHWQCSERPQNLTPLQRRLDQEAGGPKHSGTLPRAIRLDVTEGDWPAGPFDAVFSANTAHIMPAAAVPALLAGSAGTLATGGLLLLYGPFRYGDRHTSASNAAFDAHLRAIDPAMGVRDALELTRQAEAVGLIPAADLPLPANNRILIFRREVVGGDG
jgi:cyclopropane fatty-acyl-phospholipid synthase-like methyltransferase